MRAESAALDQLLESIADGETADALEQAELRLGPNAHRFLPHLRLVAAIADLHRSLHQQADAAPAAGSRALRPGDRWGNVELIEKVGEGAFGEVWRARDIHLNSEVAVKLLHPRSDRDLAERALNEGRALALLRHPHVVTVHGVELRDGEIGLRMEFVRGRTLEAVLGAQGPFSAREATVIAIELGRALAAVHCAGLVHRDVKPQNVMREEGGRIVLMDLGSGQVASEDLERIGSLAGTPLYLAPEVLGGAPATVQSDIYSLGVLLYHLVTDQYPYSAKTLSQLREQHATRPAASLHDVRPDLDKAFVRVVERALARRPDERFQTAGAMTSALSALQDEPQQRWRPGRLTVAAALVAATLAGLFGLAVGTGRIGRKPPPLSPVVSRLAVLPFTTLGRDDDLDVLSRAIPMELTASLGQIGAIKVVPWTFMKRFENGASLQTVFADTQADALVEGTIQRISTGNAEAVNLKVQVFRAGTGTLLWSQSFESRIGGLLALQAEIAGRIAAELSIVLARREQTLLGRFSNVPDEAVELYLKGRAAYEGYEGNFLVAIDYFRKVLDVHPQLAEAYAALAECYALQSSFSGAASAREAFLRATQAADKALEINPDLPDAYSARGFAKATLAWDWPGAEADFKRALDLDPSSPAAHGTYSNYLTMVGDHHLAIQHARIAEDRAPLSPVEGRRVAWAFYIARRYHEAIEQLRHVLDRDPSYDPARTLLARAYVLVGEGEAAIKVLEPIPNGFEAIAAQVYAQAGRREQARRLLAQAVLPHNLGNPPFQIAAAFAALGDREPAIAWLEKAADVHDSGLVTMADDPRLDPLRGDPRFEDLKARVRGTR
jgi:serine/threonine-protein kinase